MAKCIVCGDHERAYNDEHFCKTCREAAEKRQAEHGTEQSAAVPLGSVCHRHPSALAHWLACRPDVDLEMTLCDHCWRVEHADLEQAGWLIIGEPVTCNCAACGMSREVTA